LQYNILEFLKISIKVKISSFDGRIEKEDANMDNNLEKLRKSAHLTQCKLGRQLGLSQQVISRIERDISTITLDHLLLLADFYHVSIDYLLDRTKVKRNWEEQQIISAVLEEHYELVRAIEMLDERDTGLVWALIEKMLKDNKE